MLCFNGRIFRRKGFLERFNSAPASFNITNYHAFKFYANDKTSIKVKQESLDTECETVWLLKHGISFLDVCNVTVVWDTRDKWILAALGSMFRLPTRQQKRLLFEERAAVVLREQALPCTRVLRHHILAFLPCQQCQTVKNIYPVSPSSTSAESHIIQKLLIAYNSGVDQNEKLFIGYNFQFSKKTGKNNLFDVSPKMLLYVFHFLKWIATHFFTKPCQKTISNYMFVFKLDY